MSMPEIIPSATSRCQSLNDIIESIALEQTGLSHIINAEGEKIQAILKTKDITHSQILEVNDSVKETLNAITRLEIILQMKLELASKKECD